MRLFVALTVVSILAADDTPRGVPPRPTAADYAAKGQWQSVTFAASLVPSKQVEHLFAFDISKSYLVFEVACYADSSAALNLARSAFVVKVNGSGEAIHNAEADAVASAVQRQNLPPMPSTTGPHVSTGATIGYEHRTDPLSGRPVNGVYTAGSVTVDQGGRDNAPPRDPRPGGTSEDRRLLAAQLQARSIPEGRVNHAVAGYVFFRKSDVKAQPDDTYALAYLAEDDGTGATHAIAMSVPKKTR